MVHEFRQETRPATCCEMHTDVWYVCSCGYEQNCGTRGSNGEFNQAHRDHRIANIEAELGIEYKVGKMTHIPRPVPPSVQARFDKQVAEMAKLYEEAHADSE